MGRLSIAFFVVLGACASGMNPQECALADWRSLGFVDGESGQLLTRFDDRASQCEAYGVLADYEAYSAGYDRGLAAYCQPLTIMRLAAEGVGDVAACPGADMLMRDAFAAGQRLRRAERDFGQAEARVRSEASGIDSEHRKIANLERRFRKHTNEETKAEIIRDIGKARRRLREHRRDLEIADILLSVAAVALAEARDAYDRERYWIRERMTSASAAPKTETETGGEIVPGDDDFPPLIGSTP